MKGMWVQSLGQEDPLRRKWQPTPVLMPGNFHGQRSLAGYNPWGCKDLETTERVSMHADALKDLLSCIN